MRTKNLFMTALAALLLTSCAEDTFLGDSSQLTTGDGAISFDLSTAAETRATGATAATALGNYFLIYGEKKETAKTKYTDGNLVFPNYTVKYVTNTANTTNSNSKNWEYVNIAPLSTTYVKMNDGTSDFPAPSEQTIKYWDYSAASYTFTAVSAKSTDISSGKVIVQKNTVGADNVYQKGYTITLKEGADASKLFFADRNVVTKTTGTDRNAEAYGGYVKMNFRNLLAQIRVGMYETIPGYKVNVDRFYFVNSADPASFDLMVKPDDADNNFYANLVHQAATGFTSDITLNVTYKDNSSAAENQPIVAVSGGNATNYLTLGTNIANPAGTYIGENATAVTFDQSTADTYTTVFPQEGNTTHDLKLKVDYTLYNNVTGETIGVTGATATIPAELLQWKANYKYTYIFKIAENTNGHAGDTPAGLYPITFDAVTVDASDGSELQYITTVTDPSITTYAKASNVLSDNEYKTGSNIFVVVNDGVELTVGTNAKLYTATIESGAAQGITEETVKNALANGTKDNDETPTTWTVTDANGKDLVVKTASGLTAFTGIPASDTPDGIAIADIKGAKFTAKFTAVPNGNTIPNGVKYYTSDTGENEETSDGTIVCDTSDASKTYYVNEPITYVFEFIDTSDGNKKYYKVIVVQ